VLGAISFANDAASEMLTPLLPLFLTATLGAGPAAVAVVEGVAEATASLLKLVSGRLADGGFGTKRLLLAGYGGSNLVRPAIALASSWTWVLAMRFLDRAGKGLRTAPRDALLASSIPLEERGRAFGFQRAMDHAGSVVGPLAAAGLLAAGLELRSVFWLSLVPGALVVALVWLGLPADGPRASGEPLSLRWGALDARLRALVVAAGLLTFAALPEALLVLWASDRGVAPAAIPLLWAAAHAVKASVAVPTGRLSDRAGRLAVVAGGWAMRVAALLALAFAGGGAAVAWAGFLAYAAALASTEGAERALVGDAAPPGLRGTAYGIYHLVVGALALPGGLLLGTIWQDFGARAALLVSCGLTAVAAAGLVAIARGRGRAE
jgi:MFS family permease